MKILILLLLCFAVVGCDLETSPVDYTGSNRELIFIFIKPELKEDVVITVEHDYATNSGGNTQKGWLSVNGSDYFWRVTRRSSGGIASFHLDETTFLAMQKRLGSDERYLGFIPDNMYYVENNFTIMPTLDRLRDLGIEAEIVSWKEESNDLIYENNFHDSSDFTARDLAIQESDKSGKPAVDEDGFVFYYPNPVTERQRNVNELSPERMEQLKRSLGY